MKDVIIVNKKDLEKKKKAMVKDGVDKFHVVSDFDRTLTKAFVGGKKTPSIISELRDRDYISKDYAKRAHALFDKYHPIEMDSSVPINDKKKAMYEWWKIHFDLLIESGLNKKHIERIVSEGKIQFREKASDFFGLLKNKDIPLVIISSAGLGKESIDLFLRKEKIDYSNIYVVSNEYEWNEKGNAISVKQPIIHVMNKDETIVKTFPEIYSQIKNRRNVLLMGDSLGDTGMVDGFDYKNLIKVGFLNENVDEHLEAYKENFDVVIIGDGSMDYINKLLKEILK